MTKKVDRRVKYTKMALKDSLVQLLCEKPISRITIKEICEKADINRGTFYAHYTDQIDLLKKVEQELIADINEYLDSCFINDKESEVLQTLKNLLDYIAANAELVRVLLGENGDMDFQREIKMIVHQRCTAYWRTNKSINQNTADYIHAFIVTGSIGIIQRWLNGGHVESADEIAHIILGLVSKGMDSFV